VSFRSRLLAFGCAGALVFAGAICAVAVPGIIGQLLTIGLLSVGLGGAVLLVFLEVGLSEDRERAREARERAQADRERARRDSERSGTQSHEGRLAQSRASRRDRAPRWPRRPS
jgi:hypothetical protein